MGRATNRFGGEAGESFWDRSLGGAIGPERSMKEYGGREPVAEQHKRGPTSGTGGENESPTSAAGGATLRGKLKNLSRGGGRGVRTSEDETRQKPQEKG